MFWDNCKVRGNSKRTPQLFWSKIPLLNFLCGLWKKFQNFSHKDLSFSMPYWLYVGTVRLMTIYFPNFCSWTFWKFHCSFAALRGALSFPVFSSNWIFIIHLGFGKKTIVIIEIAVSEPYMHKVVDLNRYLIELKRCLKVFHFIWSRLVTVYEKYSLRLLFVVKVQTSICKK